MVQYITSMLVYFTNFKAAICKSITDSSYTVALLHRRLPITNSCETVVKCDCPIMGLFSPRLRNVIASIIYRYLMFSASHFKSSLSKISIKGVNAMPLWEFLQSHFEGVLKIMTIAELFVVMTVSIAGLVKLNR